MKTFSTYLYVLLWFVGASAATACSDEPEPRQDFVETGLQELDINKRGLDAEGETPVIDVRSNTYWMIRTQTQAEWLNFSPTAGSGDVEVVVEADPNNGPERTAILVFETRQGEMKRFTVRQSGAESRVTFYEGRFGDGASQLSINRFEAWENRGIGSLRCQYWGTDALVDSSSPSTGYDGASGGNNITFGSDDADFMLGGIDLKGDINFRLSFASMTSDAAFDPAALQLFISKDRQNWTQLTYTRSTAAAWERSELPFYLPEGVSQLYVRFHGANARNYRIDDIELAEGDGSGQTITFVEDIVEYETYTIFDETFDWCVGKAGEDNSTLPGSDNGGPTYQNGWSGTRVYQHPGFAKISTSSSRGWLTSPAMTAIGEKRVTVTLSFHVGIMNTDLGRFMIKVHNSGTIDGESEVEYELTSSNKWESMTLYIVGATKETQIEFTGIQDKLNRFFIDNVKATFVDIKEE